MPLCICIIWAFSGAYLGAVFWPRKCGLYALNVNYANRAISGSGLTPVHVNSVIPNSDWSQMHFFFHKRTLKGKGLAVFSLKTSRTWGLTLLTTFLGIWSPCGDLAFSQSWLMIAIKSLLPQSSFLTQSFTSCQIYHFLDILSNDFAMVNVLQRRRGKVVDWFLQCWKSSQSWHISSELQDNSPSDLAIWQKQLR